MEKLEIAFAGHTEEKYTNFPEIVERIDTVVKQIIKAHPGSHYLLGAQAGAELAIARSLHRQKQRYSFFLPCLNWMEILKNQNQDWAREYEAVFKKAQGFWAPYYRLENNAGTAKNQKMIDHADVLVVFFHEGKGSRTEEAIRMAKKKKIKVYNALNIWEEI